MWGLFWVAFAVGALKYAHDASRMAEKKASEEDKSGS